MQINIFISIADIANIIYYIQQLYRYIVEYMKIIGQVLSKNTTLYHSSSKSVFAYKPYLWTSLNEDQSKLHIYDGNCGQLLTHRLSTNQETDIWPYLYKIELSRDLRLLSVFLEDNEYYFNVGDFHSQSHSKSPSQSKSHSLSEFIKKYGIVLPVVENCFVSELNGLCNIKILYLIEYLNQLCAQSDSGNECELSDGILDGYMCFNDQREVALINSHHLIKSTKQSRLINIKSDYDDSPYIINFSCPQVYGDEYIQRFQQLFPRLNWNEKELSGDPFQDFIDIFTKNNDKANGIEKSDLLDWNPPAESAITDEQIEMLTSLFKIRSEKINTNDIDDIREYIYGRYGLMGQLHFFFNYLCNKSIAIYIDHLMNLNDIPFNLIYSRYQ